MKKILITIVATVLVCACVVGGTVAWLMDTSDTVTNTFTVGDIKISLAETVSNEFSMVPGDVLKKDPIITIDANSEDCWIYIEIIETYNVFVDEKYVNYSLTDVWNATAISTKTVENTVTTVYATNAVYAKKASSQTVQVFEGIDTYTTGAVTVNSGITKDDIASLTTNKPTIALKAYAIQKGAGTTAAEAWAAANPST